jgi:hypothetical protein
MWEEVDGTFWVGTYGRGLIRIKGRKITTYSMDCGLLDDVVWQVLGGNPGEIWVSSNKGISRMFTRDLDDFANGKVMRIQCLPFSREDGMKNRECNGMGQSAGCRTSDGHLWFPTLEGVVEVDPNNLHINEKPPTLVIDNVFADGKLCPRHSWQDFQASTKDISFHYLGLSLINPKKVQYKYRLLGYNPNWMEAGANRIATYTNLPPGQYQFQVIASNNDGVWNETGASVSFHKRAPFWATWWFLALEMLFGAALLNVIFWVSRKLFVSFKYWRKAHHIGPYRLLDTIGQGGVGTVYRARDKRDGHITAIKIIHEEFTGDEIRRQFFRECEIGENIRHPNMARIYEHGEANGRMYLVMELFHGLTLREIMRRQPMSIPMACILVSTLFEVMHSIHHLGVIHRDIKPDNILFRGELDFSGPLSREELISSMTLLDFGLARLVDSCTRTRTGLVTGTVDYLSPEYLRGLWKADTTLDFYSIGVIFYELITGHTPYHDSSTDMMQRIYAIAYSEPIPPHEFNSSIPEEVSRLSMELIEKDRERRLTDYDAIMQRLKLLG